MPSRSSLAPGPKNTRADARPLPVRFHVITLFPQSFPGPLADSVIGRGMIEGVFSICTHDLRGHGEGRHLVVDDAPFGGGPGMVLKVGPVRSAVRSAAAEMPSPSANDAPIILLDPRGRRFNQEVADGLAAHPELVLICGHYEGVDERVRESVATDSISIGDFVLTGGELAAMVMIDAVARRLPGVLGSDASGKHDSFAEALLQHPQYTRPASFDGSPVPEILVSGDHAKIAEWRRRQSLVETARHRADLLDIANISDEEREWLARVVRPEVGP